MYIEKSGYKTETSEYADHICTKENQFSNVPDPFDIIVGYFVILVYILKLILL